ncbi:MAG: cytochrome c oxidase assembly protein [Chthoniobacterales bacterium]|nr:cytochrome c oxidase assembly protein [Chthoniobacterales bacterium]
MNGLSAESVLLSWTFLPVPAFGLLAAGLIYFRGWRSLSARVPWRFPVERLLSFLGGLGVIYAALASPLDAFAGWLLIVHMVQHLLLTMVAPPLLLLGWPMLPLLSGLPRRFVREGIAPFLNAPGLKRVGRFLVHPFFAGPLFLLSNLVWHVPMLYDLALRSPGWHQFEHLCFLGTAVLFWWPVIQPWPSRPALPRWVMIPYLLLADLQNTALAAFLSFYDGVLYRTYEMAPRISDLSVLDDQAGAGAVMWVPGSLAYLIPAGIIAVSYLSPHRKRAHEVPVVRRPVPPRQRFDLLRMPGVGRLMRWKSFRPALQFSVFLLALAVVLDGFFGPQVAGINLAGVLPWLHWSGLSAIVLLVVGNLFCMACPFTFVRDLGRRIFPATREWPRRLRSKWLAVGLLAGFFWAYEYLDLWDSPWWTAWLVVFYFAGAMVVDGIFKNASFCKYVCPIGQFNFVASLLSPTEIRVREPDVCATCRTQDCIRGNETQRGCELLLFQPRKSGNMDCTFCLDCVKACPHDNIGILAVPPGRDILTDPRRSSVGEYSRRRDLATVVLVFVFAAFANVAAMLFPVLKMEESVSRNFGRPAAAGIWFIVFVFSVGLLPLGVARLCGRISSAAAGERGPVSAEGFVFALIPMGLAMWVAHISFHLFTGVLTPWPIFLRIARDLGVRSAVPAWDVAIPPFEGLVGLQILFLNVGVLFSLWMLWRKSCAFTVRALPVFLPWALVALALYVAGVWLTFQPLDMPLALVPP